ncbi:MAG: SPOR domain-containing protein [Bacteroidales bacterium]|nr:SPOR domain-containing protein [Bacteroidales bacterium]
MDFDKHIRDLLFLEDYVILPGLGAFVSNFKPAEIREETQTFIPPTKEIGFNTELQEDDSLLVDFIAKKEHIDEDQARELVYDKTVEIKEKIEAGQRVSLEGVGVFGLSGDGVLTFKALAGLNFFLDSYGLSPFHFPVLEPEREGFIKRAAIFRQAEPVIKELLPGTKSDDKGSQSRSLRRIAIAVSALLLISLIPFNAKVSESLLRHPASLGPLPSLTELDPPLEQEAQKYDSQVFFLNKAELGTVVEESRVEKTTEGKVEEKVDDKQMVRKVDQEVISAPVILPYPIIAGSFQSVYHAENLRRQLVVRGFHPATMKASNGYTRVILSRYASIENAKQALYDLKRNNPDLSLWILK